MGNALRCDTCAPAVNHSVFTFSEDLVLKVTEGKYPKPLSKAQMAALDGVGEQELFEELRCIDDSHTKAYGLSPSRVALLLDNLEVVVNGLSLKSNPCDEGVITKCYEFNKDCSIKCAERVVEYSDCVEETVRDRVHKIIVEEEKK